MAVPPIVDSTLRVITPVNPLITYCLTLPGKAFWVICRIGRKMRILYNPNNYSALLAGTIFDAAVGNRPAAQNAARVVFGSASLVKCSEEILYLVHQAKEIGDIFCGRIYIPIKHKKWDQNYFDKMRQIKNPILIRRFFHCLGEIFKHLALLALYFSDAITAYRENTTSEIFVHGKDLLDKFTDDQAPIAKYLKRYERVNDLMLAGLKLSWTTTALVGLFILGAKIRNKAPSLEEMIYNLKSNFRFVGERFEAFGERIQVAYLDLAKIFFDHVPEIERKYDFYDPDKVRFIKAPLWKKVPKQSELPPKQPHSPIKRESGFLEVIQLLLNQP